jgi:hypothetical protein
VPYFQGTVPLWYDSEDRKTYPPLVTQTTPALVEQWRKAVKSDKRLDRIRWWMWRGGFLAYLVPGAIVWYLTGSVRDGAVAVGLAFLLHLNQALRVRQNNKAKKRGAETDLLTLQAEGTVMRTDESGKIYAALHAALAAHFQSEGLLRNTSAQFQHEHMAPYARAAWPIAHQKDVRALQQLAQRTAKAMVDDFEAEVAQANDRI